MIFMYSALNFDGMKSTEDKIFRVSIKLMG